MANTQTSVPAFTAGQVLTAQQQTEINTGIPVFATTVTRDAAFGGTGEKTLAEGQFAYIEATNTTQYYDGSTWQTLGQTPGLQYITGASFSAVSSFSLPDNTFSSTYRNYKVIVHVTSASTDLSITSRLRASGADNSTTNYNYGGIAWSYSSMTLTDQGSGATSFRGANIANSYYGVSLTDWDVIAPQLAQKTQIWGGMTFSNGGSTYWGQMNFGGIFNATTQFDSMSFIASTGNITGVYRVYGYSES